MKILLKIAFLFALSIILVSCKESGASEDSVFVSSETTAEFQNESFESLEPNDSSEQNESSEDNDFSDFFESNDPNGSSEIGESSEMINSEQTESSEEAISEDPVSIEESSDELEKVEAEGFVLLAEAIPDVILEVRYYSTYNFVGDRIDGYEEPCLLITKDAAESLKKVNDELLEKGYRLKIFDAYRPVMAVEHFVRWSKDLSDEKMKTYFYPDIEKSVLFQKGFIAKKSGHSRGSTVDLTLFCNETGKEVDMGGTFDFFGEISHTYQTEGLTQQQIDNRTLLRETMIKYGFKPAKNEWWHFTLKNEPFPDTYFNFPVNSRVVKPNN